MEAGGWGVQEQLKPDPLLMVNREKENGKASIERRPNCISAKRPLMKQMGPGALLVGNILCPHLGCSCTAVQCITYPIMFGAFSCVVVYLRKRFIKETTKQQDITRHTHLSGLWYMFHGHPDILFLWCQATQSPCSQVIQTWPLGDHRGCVL